MKVFHSHCLITHTICKKVSMVPIWHCQTEWESPAWGLRTTLQWQTLVENHCHVASGPPAGASQYCRKETQKLSALQLGLMEVWNNHVGGRISDYSHTRYRYVSGEEKSFKAPTACPLPHTWMLGRADASVHLYQWCCTIQRKSTSGYEVWLGFT